MKFLKLQTNQKLFKQKAMLLFYEQNNRSAFKQVFINQFKFAVENYF